MPIITARLPEKLKKQLEKISAMEQSDRSTVMRKLLDNAVKEWRQKKALELYKQGKFSTGQAARFMRASVWEFYDLLKKHKIEVSYDAEELKEDLKAIR